MAARVVAGSGGQVTAYADAAPGSPAVFNWGDGTADSSVPVPVVPGNVSAAHTYATNGNRTLTITSGGTTATAPVAITNALGMQAAASRTGSASKGRTRKAGG